MAKKKKEEVSLDSRLLTLAKRYSWQTWLTIVIVAAIFFMQYSVIAPMSTLPGPLYGGDIYRERGFTQSLVNGDPFWADPYIKGEYAFYPPLGYIIGAGFAKITGLGVERVLILIPLLTFLIIAYGAFTLGRTFFDDNTSPMLFTLAALMTEVFVHYKHTYALGYGSALLFIAYFLKIRQGETNRRTKILCGVFLGIVALSHYKPFIFSVCIVLATTFFELIYQQIVNKSALATFKKLFNDFWLSAVIAIGIALIFFGPIVMVYNMKTLNLTNQFSLFDPSKNGVSWVLSLVWYTFFGYTALARKLQGILTLLGVVYCVLNFKSEKPRFAVFALFGMYLATAHYLVTIPLFDNYVVPSHVSGGLLIPKFLLLVCGARLIITSHKKVQHIEKIVALLLIGLCFIPLFNMHAKNNANNDWVKRAYTIDQSDTLFQNIGLWVLQNTDPSEVILAHDESAFMLNALSGRKVVTVRRTHASPYLDMDKRYADAMVMLYGTNWDVRQQLYDEYDVEYVYMDNFLAQDPMYTHPRFADYLEENGVQFSMQKVRLDPASPDAPMYDYLVIPGQNVTAEDSFSAMQGFMAGQQLYSAFYQRNEP